ncbi:MAG: DUF5711 family protein [Defluviitaleaceae bacterium]|nr:DUF5711 family protein [Defluviitaleaceae bacterium]
MHNNTHGYKWIPYIALAAIALVFIAVLGLVGVGSSPFAAAGGSARTSSSFRDISRGVSFDGASGSVFHAYNSDSYAFVTRNGVRFIGSDGEISWQNVFSLESAHLYANQEHFIVYEPRGSVAYVFSPSGMMYNRSFDGQILSVSVNSSGASAFIVRAGSVYRIYIFDETGMFPTRTIVHADDNVFPLSVAVSENGQVAAVSFLDVGGVTARSRLVFYFQNELADLHGDGLFARLQFDDEIVGKLVFFSDNSLAVVSDRAIRRVSVSDDLVRETAYFPLGNRIQSITRMGGNGLAIALGDGFVGTDSERAGTVIAFDNNLHERFRFLPDRNTTYLWANDNAVIVGAGRNIYGLAARDGRVLWNYHATQDYTQVLMLENRDTILFAARGETRVMRRVTGFGR